MVQLHFIPCGLAFGVEFGVEYAEFGATVKREAYSRGICSRLGSESDLKLHQHRLILALEMGCGHFGEHYEYHREEQEGQCTEESEFPHIHIAAEKICGKCKHEQYEGYHGQSRPGIGGGVDAYLAVDLAEESFGIGSHIPFLTFEFGFVGIGDAGRKVGYVLVDV